MYIEAYALHIKQHTHCNLVKFVSFLLAKNAMAKSIFVLMTPSPVEISSRDPMREDILTGFTWPSITWGKGRAYITAP